MCKIKVVDKIKTHFILNKLYLKIVLFVRYVEKYGRARQAAVDNIIRRMRFACWITKATDTLRIFNTHCFSTATMVKRTRFNVTFYVQCLSSYLYPNVRIFVESNLPSMSVHRSPGRQLDTEPPVFFF
jgi:hypothetical protein